MLEFSDATDFCRTSTGLRRSAGIASGVLALLIALLAAAPAGATIPSGNLLQNGGAEAGTCSNTTSPPVSIPNWTTTSSFTVVCYAADVSQTSGSGSAIGGGLAYFTGGVDTPTTASQTVDVSGAAPEIDAGQLHAALGGYLGGYAGQDDNMVVKATFLNGSASAIGTALKIGPVTAANRSDQTTMLHRSASKAVPTGTRSIRVKMIATRLQGSDNDAAADKLRLTLKDTTPPNTTITHPGTTTHDRTPTFRFHSNEAGSHFRCKRDQGLYKSCSSPKTYQAPFSLGSHVFRVKAIDAAGNVDPTPAKLVFEVLP